MPEKTPGGLQTTLDDLKRVLVWFCILFNLRSKTVAVGYM